MTGYGKVVLELSTKTVRVEIRSLNSKSLDLNMRMPNEYRSKELELRKIIGSRLKRGKIDVSLYIETDKGENSTKVNTQVVKDYIGQLKKISDGREIDLLKMAIKMPDSISIKKEEVNESEWSLILNAIEDALSRIENYRKDEGKALFNDFSNHINNINSLLQQVIETAPVQFQ